MNIILKKILSIDILILLIIWGIFIDRLYDVGIYKIILIYSIIMLSIYYIRKPFFKLNIFILFYAYIIMRMLVNTIYLTKHQFMLSLTPTIQILSITLFIPFLIKLYLKYENKIKKLLSQLNLFVFINNLIVILTIFNIFIFPEKNYEIYGLRHFGILSDQLPWITSFFILYSFHTKKLFYFFFYIVALLISGSLNAFIITLASLLIYLIFIKKLSINYFILMIISTLAFLYSNNALIERISGDDYSRSWQLRLISFQNGIETFKENMIFGHGYGTYGFVNNYFKQNPFDINNPILSASFNQFLQILCDLGIIGFILYILIIIKIYKLKTKKYTYIKIWVLSLMLLSLASVWILPGSFVYLLFIILLSIILYEDKKLRLSKKINNV